MARTIKQAMRANRQEDLRTKLSEGKHLQYAIESIGKIESLEYSETSAFTLQKLKIAAELRLRLVNKFLPDLKSAEITGDGGGNITINVTDYSEKNK